MKWPLLTGFCGSLVIFAVCTYLGARVAETVTYRWRKPLAFESLTKQDDGQLRSNLVTLQAVTFSQVKEDTPSDLSKAADYLGTIRNSDLKPVVDLQIATCYVEMARLERAGGNATSADRDQQTAEGILRSLGWQDVSDGMIAKIPRSQLWRKTTK